MTTHTPTPTDLTPEQIEAAFEREERETEVEAADAAVDAPGVGFVGCPAANGVLRVRVANRNRRAMRVTCPHGCGEHATPKSMARELAADEPEPELIEIPPVEMARDLKDRGSGRRQVSDAAIFDAIPVGRDVVAGEVAEALNYAAPSSGGRAGSLLLRLRRMNQRAEKEGVPPPFTFTRRKLGPGQPSIVISRSVGVPSNNE